MYCIKKRKRHLNNIVDFFNCEKCERYKDDEVILIGRQVIKIYPIFKGCKTIKYDFISECFNERLARMLIELSNYLSINDNYLFIWSNDGISEFIYNLDLMDCFINQGYNICIIY